MKPSIPYFRRCRSPFAGLCFLVLSICGFAQAPVVTRWMDSQGRPKSLHAVARDPSPLVLSRDLAAAAARELPRADAPHRICLIVSAPALAGAGAAVTNFVADLEAEGYAPLLHAHSGGSAEEIRAFLAALYAEPASLTGAILIGDLPHVVYEMNQDWGWGEEFEDFPCDLFYMDLDGTWSDANQTPPFAAGKYDARGGDLDLEIWVARLKTDDLPALGGEAALLNAYFGKNHRYRTAQLSPARRALLYNDDDWSDLMPDDAATIGLIYGDDHLRVVRDPESTTAGDYRQHMTNVYELMFIRSHGSPAGHGFYENGKTNFNFVDAAEYLARPPPALFYSFYVCSGCDYTESDYLAGLVVQNPDDSGLAAWGSTKTGGIWEDRFFYEPMALRQSIGEAFVAWFNAVQERYPAYAPPWWYGMVLIGDGTLRFSHSQPVASVRPGAGNQPEIRFTAQQGSRYEVRRTPSLTAPNWTNVGAFVATNYAPSLVDEGFADAAAFYAVARMEDGPSNRLANASFEVSGSSDVRACHWEASGDSHGDSWGSAARVDWRSRQGAVAAAVRGSWSGYDHGGWWQEGAAQAGKIYQATAWFWADHVDNPWTAAVQELKVEFYDGTFALLDSRSVGLSDVVETWTQKTVRATAPAGAAWARFVVNVSGASAAGALQFDGAALTEEPDP
ncbi:MAG: C25 family cysteine peptidase [Kiritimatiellia bacterium]